MEFLENRRDLRGLDINRDWRLMLTGAEIKKCISKCAKWINTHFEGKEIVLLCILKGAVYFFVDLSRELVIPHTIYFVWTSSYLNNQTQNNEVEILNLVIPSIENKIVILVDEMYDSGKSILKVKEVIHEKALVPMENIYTCTLLKKNRPDILHFPDIYGICVPDVWYVGYGLDHQQEKRNWTYLFACPKGESIEKSSDDKIFTDDLYYLEVRKRLIAMI